MSVYGWYDYEVSNYHVSPFRHSLYLYQPVDGIIIRGAEQHAYRLPTLCAFLLTFLLLPPHAYNIMYCMS